MKRCLDADKHTMSENNDTTPVKRSWKKPRLAKISIKEVTRGGFFMGNNDFFMRMFMFMS